MEQDFDEILYSIALRACPLVGDVNFAKLLSATGSAKDVWHLSQSVLNKISGIGSQVSKNIGDKAYLEFAEKEIEFCKKNKIYIRLKHLGQLPYLLSECPDAPAILYQKGVFDEKRKCVSVVGTRRMTPYGRNFVEELMGQLSNQNVIIVSGLALGTDGCAHQEALNNNLPTMGVLAHGLDRIYPAVHQKMAQEILAHEGALVSEFNSSHKTSREHFLQRNRIVAGLSEFTIVVESAYGGGSMSTVNYANQYNREVFALPGRLSDKYSQGCNLVISQNKAKIISSVQDILDELGEDTHLGTASLFSPKELELEEGLKPIYHVIESHSPISLDDISLKLEIPTFKLLPILLELEMRGYIKSLSGRQYMVC